MKTRQRPSRDRRNYRVALGAWLASGAFVGKP